MYCRYIKTIETSKKIIIFGDFNYFYNDFLKSFSDIISRNTDYKIFTFKNNKNMIHGIDHILIINLKMTEL